MKVRYWQDWAILALAVWLYAAPFVMGTARLSHPATMLAWASAVVLMVSAAEAITFPDVLEEWVDVAVAALLVAGPWIFGFSHEAAPTANSVAVGVAVLACALSVLARVRSERRKREAAGGG